MAYRIWAGWVDEDGAMCHKSMAAAWLVIYEDRANCDLDHAGRSWFYIWI